MLISDSVSFPSSFKVWCLIRTSMTWSLFASSTSLLQSAPILDPLWSSVFGSAWLVNSSQDWDCKLFDSLLYHTGVGLQVCCLTFSAIELALSLDQNPLFDAMPLFWWRVIFQELALAYSIESSIMLWFKVCIEQASLYKIEIFLRTDIFHTVLRYYLWKTCHNNVIKSWKWINRTGSVVNLLPLQVI